MKRSKPINAILKVLKTWEGCQMTKETGNEILAALEKLEVICPPEIIVKYIKLNGKKEPVYGMEWDK
jgi:hypothetical protein